MCIAFIILGFDIKNPLIVITNRDEFYARITTKMDWHNYDNCKILNAKDIMSNGAQFAIGENGNFAVLTNFRENHENKNYKSRGELTVNFIKNKYVPIEYISFLIENHANYSGFNLIFGDVTGKNVWFFSNRTNIKNETYIVKKLDFNNIYGFGNGYFDSKWWKVSNGINMLQNIKTPIFTNMFNILLDDTLAPFNRIQYTGCSEELEYNLSGIFCNKYITQNKDFGTIGSYVYIVKKQNDNDFLIEVTEHCKYTDPNLFTTFEINYEIVQ
jgi:uncharacterized protein with NRDE domain